MSFTIENILAIDNLKGVKLVAGEKGLNRLVKWVTILEVLDELNYLDEGDLLVTTGYGLAEDQELQNSLIELLDKKNMAGIAIQPGFSLVDIPAALLKEADKRGFPVLYLPKEFSFSRFTRHILKHLINHQFYLLEYSQRIYKQLTKLVLNNQGLDSIAETLVEMIKKPVIILDLFYNPIVKSLTSTQDLELFYYFVEEMKVISNLLNIKSQYIKLNNGNQVYLVSITTGSEVLGYLCVLNPEDYLEEMDAIAIEHTATLAALVMLKEIAVKETENSLRGDFLEETLKGENPPQILAKKAATFGYDKNKGYHLALFNLASWDMITNCKTESQLFSLKKYLLTSIEHCISKYGLRYMYKFSHDKILLLLQVSNEDFLLTEKASQEIIDMVKAKYGSHGIMVGISNYYSKLENLNLAYQEASRAIELAGITNKTVTLFTDIEVYNLFYEISRQDFSQNFFKEKLGLLIEYDKKNGSQMVTTLEHFLACNCNLQETSTSLYVHRHTLRYRLQRIKEITGLDPLISQDRLKLQMALMLLKVI
ncbi:MAG: PucR family transcriptional regulator ligand-binding domain-containing protein [Clostridia bacterium]|nr:PucR family transcriptional regulator ligand-binding domain-containing protein [Clostridia bacterium]